MANSCSRSGRISGSRWFASTPQRQEPLLLSDAVSRVDDSSGETSAVDETALPAAQHQQLPREQWLSPRITWKALCRSG